MKIKKYNQFLNESFSSKNDILKYFDENKQDILSKNLNFSEMRQQLSKVLDMLDDSFLHQKMNEIQSIDMSNKDEFNHKFTEILHSILEEVEGVNEGFLSSLNSLWQSIKNTLHKAVQWISDRIYTITGVLTMTLSGVLLVIKEWFGGLGMPDEFGNVVINAVLILGITILKYGQEVDNYKKVSEI